MIWRSHLIQPMVRALDTALHSGKPLRIAVQPLTHGVLFYADVIHAARNAVQLCVYLRLACSLAACVTSCANQQRNERHQ